MNDRQARRKTKRIDLKSGRAWRRPDFIAPMSSLLLG